MFITEASPEDEPGAFVVEMTQTPTPQMIQSLVVDGQTSYRTIHLPSLYPGVQW
jgi:hypothetical protein